MASRKVTVDSVIIFPKKATQATDGPSCPDNSYQGIFENALIGIFKTTMDGALLDLNPAYASMFGYDSPQQMMEDVPDVSALYLRSEDRTAMIESAKANAGALPRWETEFRRRDGSTFTGRANLKVITGADGKPRHIEGCLEDITDEKRMREAIRESEEKFRGVYEESPFGLVIFDELGRLISANQTSLRIMGIQNISEVIGFRLFEAPYVSDRTRERLKSGATTSSEIEFSFDEVARKGIINTTKRGNAYLEFSIKPLGCEDNRPPTGYLMQIQDITERKRIEEDLRKAQTVQKAILDNIPDIAWLKDRDGRFIAVNEPFGRSCGLRPEEVAGKTDLDIWPPELAQRYRSDDREVMASGRRKRVEEPLADKEGRIQWIETIKTPVRDDKGEVVGTTGIARDITDRKRAEEEVESVREELESRISGLNAEIEKQKAEGKRSSADRNRPDDKQKTLT